MQRISIEKWQLEQRTNSTAALPKQHIVQWSVCRKRGGLPQTEQTTVLLAPSSSPPVCQQRPSMLLKWTLMWENEGRKYSSWRLQSVGNVPGIHIPLNRSQLEICIWSISSSLSINSGCALEVDTPVGKARSQIWQLGRQLYYRLTTANPTASLRLSRPQFSSVLLFSSSSADCSWRSEGKVKTVNQLKRLQFS